MKQPNPTPPPPGKGKSGNFSLFLFMSANLAAIDELVEEFLKMELISVPPYPGQLGYLGSTKVNGKCQTQIKKIG